MKKWSMEEKQPFAAIKKTVRKDLEQTFETSVERFQILSYGCRLLNQKDIEAVMFARVIIQNTLVEAWCKGYESTIVKLGLSADSCKIFK